jgi:hypothetical protein
MDVKAFRSHLVMPIRPLLYHAILKFPNPFILARHNDYPFLKSEKVYVRFDKMFIGRQAPLV